MGDVFSSASSPLSKITGLVAKHAKMAPGQHYFFINSAKTSSTH